MTDAPREFWMRGPVAGVPALLQPVAHALLQAGAELDALLVDFPDRLLWHRPAGVASVGFHLKHIVGVLDRLFTYARGETLSEAQLAALRAEGTPSAAGAPVTVASLRESLAAAVARAVERLGDFSDESLSVPRRVGRAGLPSTTLGLLFHAAEHTMRHTGQAIVTVRVIADEEARRAAVEMPVDGGMNAERAD